MTEHPLPNAELEVLASLYRQEGEATARQLRESMHPYRPMAHGSMLTLLKRLEAKQIVRKRRSPSGKAYLYAPVHSPREAFRPLFNNLINRVFGGDCIALVDAALEFNGLTQGDLDRLSQIVERHRELIERE